MSKTRYTVNGGEDVDLTFEEVEYGPEFRVTGYAHGVANLRKLIDELDAACKYRETKADPDLKDGSQAVAFNILTGESWSVSSNDFGPELPELAEGVQHGA